MVGAWWSVVSGQWSVVSGWWPGVCAWWSVVGIQWSVFGGRWSVVGGRCLVVGGRWWLSSSSSPVDGKDISACRKLIHTVVSFHHCFAHLILVPCSTPNSSSFTHRIAALADWLASQTVSWSKPGGLCEARACTGHFQAIAAVIWASAGTDTTSLVCNLFSEDLFRYALYNDCIFCLLWSVKDILYVQ